MEKALITVVAAALGLVSHARVHRISLGAPGDELLRVIDRAMPGTVAGFNMICLEGGGLGFDPGELQDDIFPNVFVQAGKVAPVDEVQGQTKPIDKA